MLFDVGFVISVETVVVLMPAGNVHGGATGITGIKSGKKMSAVKSLKPLKFDTL